MVVSGAPLSTPVNLQHLLRSALDSKPDDDAIVCADNRLTWRTLDTSSTNLAANLIGLGLRPGDRIASLMPNRIALVVHYLACLKAGLVATPLNYRYMAPEIDHALEVSGARTILAHSERNSDLAASQRVASLPLGVNRYGSPSTQGPKLEDLIEEKAPEVVLNPLRANDPAYIFSRRAAPARPRGSPIRPRPSAGCCQALPIAPR